MAPKWFQGWLTTVPIIALAVSLLHSHLLQRPKVVPVHPSKPVMSTKTAQLGGTASNVTIGKIGVSAHPSILLHPDIDLSIFSTV
jgi:hypothetical protein